MSGNPTNRKVKTWPEWDKAMREACEAGVLPALADALRFYFDPDDYEEELPLPLWLRKALLEHLEQMMRGGLKTGPGSTGTVWSRYRADMRHLFRWRAVKNFKDQGSTWEEAYELAHKKLQKKFGYGSCSVMKDSYQKVQKGLKDPSARGRYYLAMYPNMKLMEVGD